MFKTFKVLIISILFPVFSHAADELKTVPQVDLNKYMGTWFEIAAMPQKFQKDCFQGTKAEYKLLENGLVQVLNSCLKENGETKSAEGRAMIADKTTNAKLKVTFVKVVDWIFRFGGDYWVIDLAPDYSYAVVGHPKREYGWILSRTSSLSFETIKGIEERLKEKGYDTCKFITTIQEGGLDERVKLCELSPSK